MEAATRQLRAQHRGTRASCKREPQPRRFTAAFPGRSEDGNDFYQTARDTRGRVLRGPTGQAGWEMFATCDVPAGAAWGRRRQRGHVSAAARPRHREKERELSRSSAASSDASFAPPASPGSEFPPCGHPGHHTSPEAAHLRPAPLPGPAAATRTNRGRRTQARSPPGPQSLRARTAGQAHCTMLAIARSRRRPRASRAPRARPAHCAFAPPTGGAGPGRSLVC